MSAATVRILADDLTDALAVAAPLTVAYGPLTIVGAGTAWPDDGASLVFDTESRARDASEHLAAGLRGLGRADIAFKAIDPRVRGNTVREIAACIVCGLFKSVVIAPAFPALQRITRGARQYWRAGADARWQPAGPELPPALCRLGADVRACRSARELEGQGAFVVDAASEMGLAAIVEAGRRLEPPLLWIGSAGLARALAGGQPPTVPFDPERPLLAVIDGRHPAGRDQIDALAGAHPDLIVALSGSDRPAVAATRARIEVRLVARHAAVLTTGSQEDVADDGVSGALRQVFDGLIERIAEPATLVVSGDHELRAVTEALGAEALRVEGEVMPGVALAGFLGGRWPDARLVAQSSRLGEPDALLRLIGL